MWHSTNCLPRRYTKMYNKNINTTFLTYTFEIYKTLLKLSLFPFILFIPPFFFIYSPSFFVFTMPSFCRKTTDKFVPFFPHRKGSTDRRSETAVNSPNVCVHHLRATYLAYVRLFNKKRKKFVGSTREMKGELKKNEKREREKE